VSDAAVPTPERSPAGVATVTVAGAGGASAVPDTALLELGVETRGSTPAEALDACARALELVRAAVATGGDGARVHGLGLVVGDPAGVAAGMAIGPVLEIREAPPPPPDARPMRLLSAEAAPAGPATEPGETTVWAAVTVSWALRRPGSSGATPPA
jgi:uncharacterized protein YggE